MAKPKNARVYYDKPLKKVFSWFNVNPEMGLSSEQAITSFHEHGPNEIKKVKRSFFKVIIAPIINLLIIIYLLSAVAMAALGEVERTTPTFIIVGFNIVVAVIQQYRAERKLEALHKLSQSTSKVLRHGEVIQIPSDKVVVGDIVILNRGDKVPADARIIE